MTAPLPADADRVASVTFDEVYRAHALTVARWAARLGAPWLDPEDVTHDVFLKVQRSRLDEVVDLEAWLYTITVNVIRTRRRVERFRRWFQRPEADAASVASDAPHGLDALEQRDAQRVVTEGLAQLSDRDREVLVLFELEDRSGKEIARLMGVPVDRVWVWLHRARARFAKAVEAQQRRTP
jgi:RNA polymerase sigma-70 factor, ECF subfamily